MTRPDDEFPPLDVTSTLNLGALDDVMEGPDADVVPGRMSGSLPPGMALLVVRRGPNAGARFLLDHDVTTSGRHPDSDIFLDDVTVSRRHAEFHREGGTFTAGAGGPGAVGRARPGRTGRRAGPGGVRRRRGPDRSGPPGRCRTVGDRPRATPPAPAAGRAGAGPTGTGPAAAVKGRAAGT